MAFEMLLEPLCHTATEQYTCQCSPSVSVLQTLGRSRSKLNKAGEIACRHSHTNQKVQGLQNSSRIGFRLQTERASLETWFTWSVISQRRRISSRGVSISTARSVTISGHVQVA